jgi:hypothetical protein
MLECDRGGEEVAAAFSRSICSLLSKTSDFLGSGVAEALVTAALASGPLIAVIGLDVPAAVVESFASSTSPSSTSVAFCAFGVDVPRELSSH